MKILVLGNGFDLDHELPTSYMDFLNFCNYVMDMDNPNSQYFEKLKESQKKYVDILNQNEAVKKTFQSFLSLNRFLTYFNNKIDKQGNNWIDFEREIKNIVSKFKELEYEFKKANTSTYIVGINHQIHEVLEDLGLEYIDRNEWDEITLTTIHYELCRSLDNFSKALEYYIYVFVNTTSIDGISPDIISFEANNVLTFNYSDTYERIYGGIHWNESVDHVHGYASGKIDGDPSIILGITSESEKSQSSYVEFEKYFQRITKKTGSKYKNWLQSRLGKNEKIEVVFFGHSLDSSDSDIIKDLICKEESHVKIYYFDDSAYKQIVANLIEIIGKNELIKYVSGRSPKILFLKQSEHQTGISAGAEISRDIKKIYRFYEQTKSEIDKTLTKIKNKVEEKDLNYFISQRKTISLFEALVYCGVDFVDKKSFFEICQTLNYETSKNGNVIKYFDEEWESNNSWGDIINCETETSKLILAVNQSNQKRFEEAQSKRKYAYFLSLNSSEEMKAELIKIFSNETPSDAYWNELIELIRIMFGNEKFVSAIRLIDVKSLSLCVRTKATHFINVFDDYCYEYEMAKQAAENGYEIE